ncbi:hypothetical protein [Flavobacterium hydrophilum]|uniref:Uncharacterized protein n=1 Tax=Flavobacterium hydrophilum TaxID=2211445 RepID=A0A2V4C534_9FLAO|nr:hypothetical protein [Flavobacterium hydrophilum]PXY45223.1 hypothetical protein DMB68_11045 [Flavobacterium hydrophilum]
MEQLYKNFKQEGVPVPANQEPLQIYTDLAWGGLQEAPIFAEKFPVGSADYLRIKDSLDPYPKAVLEKLKMLQYVILKR